MLKGTILHAAIKVVEAEPTDGALDVLGSCVADAEQFEGFRDVDLLVIQVGYQPLRCHYFRFFRFLSGEYFAAGRLRGVFPEVDGLGFQHLNTSSIHIGIQMSVFLGYLRQTCTRGLERDSIHGMRPYTIA